VKFVKKSSARANSAKNAVKRADLAIRSLHPSNKSKSGVEPDRSGNSPSKRPFKVTFKQIKRPPLQLTDSEDESDKGLNASGNKRGMHATSESMRKIRAMRRIYRNKQLPVLQCSSCAYAQNCPSYKAGYECAYLPFLNAHSIDNEKDIVFYMRELISAKIRRIHIATMMETMSGATPSLELSESMQMAVDSLMKLHERMQETEENEASFEGDASIVGKLFGNISNLLADTKQAQLEYSEVVPVPNIVRKDGHDSVIDIDVEKIEEVRPSNVNHALADEFEKDELTKFNVDKPETQIQVSSLV
jgi:hypothetical protein